MLMHLPKALRTRWFEKSTDVCPHVRNGSRSPQWCAARWRRQGTVRKNLVNSTDVVFAAISHSNVHELLWLPSLFHRLLHLLELRQDRCSPAQSALKGSPAFPRTSLSLDSETKFCRSPPSGTCMSCASWLFCNPDFFIIPTTFSVVQSDARLFFFFLVSSPPPPSVLALAVPDSCPYPRSCFRPSFLVTHKFHASRL